MATKDICELSSRLRRDPIEGARVGGEMGLTIVSFSPTVSS